jgi:hypothetical protein
MKTDVLERLLPISEAADKIHIAEKTLRNWRTKGVYPQIFIKLGGKLFIDLDELSGIIIRQREKAIADAKRLDIYE